MEDFKILETNNGLCIDGFTDAEKAILLKEKDAKRLSDLFLHKADLDFAESCLDSINLASPKTDVIKEALWRASIIHYLKCFSNSGARSQISEKKVLRGEPPQAIKVFNYFKALRNRHLVHDENSYSQCIPVAILNKREKNYKIEKIICVAIIAQTHTQNDYDNLRLLIQKSRAFVISEFDQLCKKLTDELEKESYDNLLARESPIYRVPTSNEIHKNRKSIHQS